MKPNLDMSRLLSWTDRPVQRLKVPLVPKTKSRVCAFDPTHHFTVAKSVTPTPSFCSPACMAAALRQERRLGRLS